MIYFGFAQYKFMIYMIVMIVSILPQMSHSTRTQMFMETDAVVTTSANTTKIKNLHSLFLNQNLWQLEPILPPSPLKGEPNGYISLFNTIIIRSEALCSRPKFQIPNPKTQVPSHETLNFEL
jgi:hypothetical protein